MATLQIILDAVKQNAPLVKLNERYQPSGVEWYLDQVVYVAKGQAPVGPPATPHLRLGAAGKDDYMQIPESAADNIEPGNLASAKALVHVLGLDPIGFQGWLDVEYWFFYPYNGPASARLELVYTYLSIDTDFNVDFKIFGEHEGDWEHVTIRLEPNTNSDGFHPVAVYFSQHDGGEWISAGELERISDGRIIVYSSRDGHASFPSAGIFPTKKAHFNVESSGARCSGFLANFTTRNTVDWDTQNAHEVVSIRYVNGVEVADPPTWLGYIGRWGRVWTSAERQQRSEQAVDAMRDEIVQRLPHALPSFVSNGVADMIKGVVALAPLDEIVPDGPTGLRDKAAWEHEEGEPLHLGWNMYLPQANTNVTDVLSWMSKFLMTFDNDSSAACTAKMAACNQRGGNARGVIYYYIGKPPLEPLYGNNWSAQVFKTYDSYDQDLFTPALEFLNGLPLEHSLAAQVTMSNYQGGTATLVVWWPANAAPLT